MEEYVNQLGKGEGIYQTGSTVANKVSTMICMNGGFWADKRLVLYLISC